MISSLIMGKNPHKHWTFSERFLQGFYRFYEPLIRWALRWKKQP
ncbi:MAG: hypothetical protein R2822_22730 [Spirosomataceae bacterium]